MEGRAGRYGSGRASPERSMVWTEPPMKHRRRPQEGRKVPVVYYLCRNHHLEHPHFIEVPLSSPEGLYLRDVVCRLKVLRGMGMPAMYSWSCKRSYKNGFVWHDVAEDDLLIPAHGNDYVLKGSELFDQYPSDRLRHSTSNPQLHNPEHPQQKPPTSSRIQEGCSSSSSPTVVKEARPPPPPPPPQEDELSPTYRQGSDTGSPGLVEDGVRKASGRADASTQTEDGSGRRACQPDSRAKIVLTDEPLDLKFNMSRRNQTPYFNKGCEKGMSEISLPPTSSSASSPGRKMDTLESLIRADVSRMNRFRMFEVAEEEDVLVPTKAKLKTTNMLMQLVTCGSVSVKDHHSFGVVPTYKPRFSHMKLSSPMFTSSMVLGEIDFLSENPRGLRKEEKKYSSGSVIETKQHMEEVGEGVPSLKPSSPCGEDRSNMSPCSKWNEQKVVNSARSKRLPRTSKTTSCKQSWNGTVLSPISDARNSSASLDCSKSTPLCSSKGGSRRLIDAFAVEGSSMSLESFEQENEVIKVAESLLQELRL